KAHPDRAYQAVLVQVQDDAGARLPGSCERTPPEGWVEVVRVHHAGARATDRVVNVVRAKPAAQKAGCGSAPSHQRRVTLQQLGFFSEVLADQPHQVGNGPLLPARRAIAAVKK